ncbi:MAG: homoserine dehydrogenase [Clostridia bacterium]|nr:homoserine dehydrogenase [Clostridia bacterium]
MVNVAILGFGVVGSGAAEVLTDNRRVIEKNLGETVAVKRILDLRDFPDSPFGPLVTHDFNDILNDPDITIVAEMMGGSHPAYDFTKACLEAGKSVVTSNKEVVANFGAELLELAAKNGARYLFEASVGGGIPIIRPMVNDLASNEILSVNGILNGTTNYILTKMLDEGADYADVLKDAQQKGYAERNPAADVEGLDAARKIVILAALSFGKLLNPNQIYCEGITKITAEDAETAKAFGCSVKLIGHTELMDGKVLAMVSPRMVPCSNPLAGVADVFNGILVDANMLGECMFYGKGAGKLPTASAVVADIIDIVAHRGKTERAPKFAVATESDYADMSAYATKRCFSFENTDGAAAKIKAVFGDVETVTVGNRIAFISEAMTEAQAEQKAAEVGLNLISRIRML